jgi:26S proteasome regulatory subunit N1
LDNGFEFIDKYVESENTDIQSGAFIALGLLQSGIKNEADDAFAVLTDKLESATK